MLSRIFTYKMILIRLLDIGRKKLQHFIPSRFHALKYQRILEVATIEETVDTWVIKFSNENRFKNAVCETTRSSRISNVRSISKVLDISIVLNALVDISL